VTEFSLFIRLYLDEDVSVLVAELLRPHGFDVLTTRDAKNRSQTDIAQLRFAAGQQRALLTHNRVDYESLHATVLHENHSHGGILIANRRASDFDLTKRIMKLLNTFTAEDMVNQLLYL
jgi:uncharacterized protein with PIN domain